MCYVSTCCAFKGELCAGLFQGYRNYLMTEHKLVFTVFWNWTLIYTWVV